MIRFAIAALCLGLTFGLTVNAEDKKEEAKEKVVKGTICCAKCELKKSDKCETVIKAKEGDKEVIYYFDAASHKKFHADICQEAKEGSVTGAVKKEGDKWWIAATKVEYK